MQAQIICPQAGYQMRFLSSSADIVIGGGAAGVGKTFTLLLDPIRHKDVPGFGGVIFRRTTPQIRREGGLWDASMKLYPLLGASPKESTLDWKFPKGQNLKFSHLEYEKDVLGWQGTEIPFIGFDELTHFSKKMFFYMLTRNRSTCGIKPVMRATTNPDPDSWVAELIEWWIDPVTGFPIPERDGVIRYFMIDNEAYIWGNTKQEVIEKASFLINDKVKESGIDADDFVKSITFISGSIYDNHALLKTNPQYLANLMAQDSATRAALLDGNWHFVVSENDIYEYADFLGIFENEFTTKSNDRYITADIAGRGSDKFVVGVWYGKELMDAVVMAKSNGPEVIGAIRAMAQKHIVPNKHIIYDSDGIGGLVDGFFVGAIGFVGGAQPLEVYDTNLRKKVKENYYNLKTQLVYRNGVQVAAGAYKMSGHAQSIPYDEKMTLRQRLIYERKAFKRDKVDKDGKLRIIPKDEQKVILQNQSPDVMDMWYMREYFEIMPKPTSNMGWVGGFQ